MISVYHLALIVLQPFFRELLKDRYKIPLIVTGKTEKEHLANLDFRLQCDFFQNEIEYLGHVIENKEGVHPQLML